MDYKDEITEAVNSIVDEYSLKEERFLNEYEMKVRLKGKMISIFESYLEDEDLVR